MSNENPPSQESATQQAKKIPADYGLPGLGLSMQLAGGIFSVFIGATLLTMMMAPGGSREMFWLFLLAAAAVARSGYHAAAGRHLLYNEQPLRLIPTYFAVSAMQGDDVAFTENDFSGDDGCRHCKAALALCARRH